MDRRRRAGEVVDLVDFDVQRKGDVVADELEAGIVVQMLDVALGAGEKVIMQSTSLGQPIAEVGTEETCAAGDEDALAES